MSETTTRERVALALLNVYRERHGLGPTFSLAEMRSGHAEEWLQDADAAIAAMQPVQIVQPDTLGMGDYAEMMMGQGKR